MASICRVAGVDFEKMKPVWTVDFGHGVDGYDAGLYSSRLRYLLFDCGLIGSNLCGVDFKLRDAYHQAIVFGGQRLSCQ